MASQALRLPLPAPAGTYDLQWQMLNQGAAAYQTACTPVAID
jgi:hypothetical protein